MRTVRSGPPTDPSPGRPAPLPSRPAEQAAPPGRWRLVLPVKGGPGAKSRLGGPPELATAIARDCLRAALDCRQGAGVVVVTSDPQAAAWSRRAGAEVVPERRPGAGLVAAVRDGVLAVADRPGPVAVLLADVPAARPEDLARALQACAALLAADPGAPMALVPDAEGTGSVLLAARSAEDLDPAFGPGSAAEHLRRGARRVELDLPRLRRDVDTPADLLAALELGCGPRTRGAATRFLARTGHLAGTR